MQHNTPPQLADKDPKTIAIILEDLVLTTSSTDAFSSIKENQLSIVDFDQIKWIFLVLNLFAFCSLLGHLQTNLYLSTAI